jgi:hypothetical protein
MNFIKDRFIAGGYEFMSVLTLLLIITTAWIIYQFVIGYNSKQPNQEKILRKIGYGKSMGMFALATGFLGQMIGLTGMFEAIRSATSAIDPRLIYDAIRVTTISAMYGVLIYLFSLILWFIASFIIEKKLEVK